LIHTNNEIRSPSDVLKENKTFLKHSKRFKEIDIAVLTNYSANFLEPYVKNFGFKSNIKINLFFPDFDQIEKSLHKQSFFKEKKIIFISFLLDYLFEKLIYRHFGFSLREKKIKALTIIKRIKKMVELIQRKSNSKIIIFNFPQVFLDFNNFSDQSISSSFSSIINYLNIKLDETFSNKINCYIYDFSSFISKFGSINFFDEKKSRIAFLPFSLLGLNQTGYLISRCARAISFPPKKCLVVDLDDTLWGGILGEVGPTNIILGDDYNGYKYMRFQKKILSLKERGILLAISSKNNLSDVKRVFKENNNLVLSLKDFSSTQINWEDKATNIRQIAKELNLGLDSIVFFDNSPLEREWVKKKIPEVSVVKISEDHNQFLEDLENSCLFDQFFVSEEDKKRHKMYKQDFKRKKALSKSENYEDFLKSLKIKTEIKLVNKFTIQRCAQLVERTNQFNLTNYRYQANEILNFLQKKSIGLSIKLSDKFGDYGIVGFSMAVKKKNYDWLINVFVVSCRALGRNVEDILLKKLITKIKEKGGKQILGIINRTEKNKMAHKFYSNFGFKKKGKLFIL